MKERIKGFIVGVFATIAFLSATAVFAAGSSIEVIFANIRFMIDGVEKRPTTGESFIYNGTTYVPLRFVAEATGKPVNWDGKNNTIWIGKQEGEFKYLSNIEYARAEDTARSKLRINEWQRPAGLKFKVAGNEFLNGIGIVLDESMYDFNGPDNKGAVEYNLNSQYKKLTGKVGIDDTTKNSENTGRIIIYGDGKEIYRSPELIGGNNPIDISVDTTGVLKLRIEFEALNIGDQLNIVFLEPKIS